MFDIRIIRKVNWILQQIELWLGKILVGVILVVAGLQIIFRYLLRMPLSWTNEVACFSLVWVTFLSVAYIFSIYKHVSLTMITVHFSERTNLILKSIFCVLIAAGLICLLPSCINNMNYMPLTPELRIPQEWVYSIVPVSFLFICYHAFCIVCENIILLRKKEVE